ncbi:MAG: hypothetical protein ABJI00_10060 [Paracoccaceae bacterium]
MRMHKHRDIGQRVIARATISAANTLASSSGVQIGMSATFVKSAFLSDAP